MTLSSTLAYLDPGSSSAFLQILAGGLAAVAVSVKLFWRRILIFLHIRKEEPEPDAASKPGPSKTDSR